jgi:hypothetical protein
VGNELTTIALTLFITVGSACHPIHPNTMPANPPVSVEWQLTRAQDALLVVYTVKNASAQAVWLADKYEGADRLVVRNDATGVAALVAAATPPDPNFTVEHPELHLPGVHELPAHSSFTRTVLVPLPLEAWHYRGSNVLNALDPGVSRLVLEIGYLPDPTFHPKLTAEGRTVNTPAALIAFSKQTIVRGKLLDLPPGS